MELVNSKKLITKPLVWLEINRERLLYNVTQMKNLVGNAPIMAVVKANAYGIGAVEVATVVEPTVDSFGVVGIADAMALRNAGIKKPIVNLGIYNPADAEELMNNDIRSTVFTFSAVEDMEQVAQKLNKKPFVWVKVDTGLTRLGTSANEAVSLIQAIEKSNSIQLEGVYSTLTEDLELDRTQLQLFTAVQNKCAAAGITVPFWSIGSSQDAFMRNSAMNGLVRLGISLLGYYPSAEAEQSNAVTLRPVATYKSKIACVKQLQKGESVFYKRTYVAKQQTRIAVLLAGYSYGLDSRMVTGGEVLINGKRFPLVGGISATNSFVDIGNDTTIEANDEAVFFGNQGEEEISVSIWCSLLHQSEYEFLSGIPPRVARLIM